MLNCDSSQIAANTEYFWDVLKIVTDPEVGVNIVDLGMVYSIDLKNFSNGQYDVFVEMTLTSPTCPLADIIIEEIKAAVYESKKATNVEVSLVFDPPWNIDMITAEGKMQLGLL